MQFANLHKELPATTVYVAQNWRSSVSPQVWWINKDGKVFFFLFKCSNMSISCIMSYLNNMQSCKPLTLVLHIFPKGQMETCHNPQILNGDILISKHFCILKCLSLLRWSLSVVWSTLTQYICKLNKIKIKHCVFVIFQFFKQK